MVPKQLLIKQIVNIFISFKRNLSPHLAIYTKIHPKWITDQLQNLTLIKLLEENIDYLCDLRVSDQKDFLDIPQKAQSTKEKIYN